MREDHLEVLLVLSKAKPDLLTDKGLQMAADYAVLKRGCVYESKPTSRFGTAIPRTFKRSLTEAEIADLRHKCGLLSA